MSGTITIHWSAEVQPGETTVITVEDRERAQDAANDAQASAEEAAKSLSLTPGTFSIDPESGQLLITRKDGIVERAGEARGPQGEKGKDGANVLPTDTAIAQALNTLDSATRAAIVGLINSGVGAKVIVSTVAPPVVAGAIWVKPI